MKLLSACRKSVTLARGNGTITETQDALVAALFTLAKAIDSDVDAGTVKASSFPPLLAILDELGLSKRSENGQNRATLAVKDAPVVPIHRSWRDSLPA